MLLENKEIKPALLQAKFWEIAKDRKIDLQNPTFLCRL